MISCEIKMKLPSANEYINWCRTNKYKAAKEKRRIEDEIIWQIKALPKFENPVVITFRWVESNKRRDLDNIAFGKKFLLDALVKAGKLADDNRKIVTAFRDEFEYGKENKVVLEIEEEQTMARRKIQNINERRIFADNLRELVDTEGVTLTQIAMETGISQGAISQYVHGTTVPNIFAYRRLCEFFKVDMTYFFRGIEDEIKVWYGEPTSRLDVQTFNRGNYISEEDQLNDVNKLIQELKSKGVEYTVFRGQRLVNM